MRLQQDSVARGEAPVCMTDHHHLESLTAIPFVAEPRSTTRDDRELQAR